MGLTDAELQADIDAFGKSYRGVLSLVGDGLAEGLQECLEQRRLIGAHSMLTDSELDAIRERAEKAPAGPWVATEFGIDCPSYRYDGADHNQVVANNLYDGGGITDDSVADFISHAREDIPKLLAEIDRLRSQRQRLWDDVRLERGFGLYWDERDESADSECFAEYYPDVE